MATIDSGLGWTCDSKYYCDDTATVVVRHGFKEAHKATAGGAIAVNVLINGWWSCAVLSTVQSYAQTDNSDNSYVHTAYNGSIAFNGLTWYMYIQGAGTGSAQTSFPEVRVDNGETIAEPGYMPLTMQAILEAAGVQSTAAKIPSTEYVKTFVEGVEAETATRVNALYNMIAPTFNTATSYVIDDIVIYSNKLYKCTTAHSGAWNSSDFTETTIAQLFR